MIFLDTCTVRAIFTAVTLLVGLSTPSIFMDQRTELLSREFSSTTDVFSAPSDLMLDSGNELSLTLTEWIIVQDEQNVTETDELLIETVIEHSHHSSFNCAAETGTVHSLPLTLTVNGSSDESDIPPSQFFFSGFEIDLPSNFTEISLQSLRRGLILTLDAANFVTESFETVVSPLPLILSSQFEWNPFSQTRHFGCLAALAQLRLCIRELILHSLPTHWAEWTTHNRLTLGVVCVSVMFCSLLCPILYYLWTVNKTYKHLTKDLKTLSGIKWYAKSQLQTMAIELNELMKTNSVYRNELKDTKVQLRQSQLLGIETTDELALITKELYLEKCDARRNVERIKSEHAKVLAKVNRKLEDTKRQVSWYQMCECQANMEFASLKKQVKEERMEQKNKQQSTSQIMTELHRELLITKSTLKGNLETTQQKLRLATDRALELKLRFADSVMSHSEISRKDSGLFWD